MTLLAAASRYSERSRCWSMSRPTMPTRHGVEIVRRALEAPARQIAENAVAEGSIIIGKLRETSEFAYGWNAQTNEFGDLYKQGVIDPVKVVRTALQDAASVAGLLVTTEAMVAKKPKRKRRSPDAWWRHGLLTRTGMSAPVRVADCSSGSLGSTRTPCVEVSFVVALSLLAYTSLSPDLVIEHPAGRGER
jgi:hypothetical protein